MSTYTASSPTSSYPTSNTELNNLLESQGICGPNHYIKTENSNQTCDPCSNISITSNLRMPDRVTDLRKQCKFLDEDGNQVIFNDNEWFNEQKRVSREFNNNQNSETIFESENWSDANSVTSQTCQNQNMTNRVESIRKACRVLNYYEQSEMPLTNEEIQGILGIQSFPNEYALNIDDLRNKISSTRGSTVNRNSKFVGDQNAKWVQNWNSRNDETNRDGVNINDSVTGFNFNMLQDTSGTYGPNLIIEQEVREFQMESYGDPRDIDMGGIGGIGGINLQQLFGNVAANDEFENCMNNILDDNTTEYCNGLSHLEIQEQIKNLDNISHLKPCHIRYIEDKLKRISIVDVDDAQECMGYLNLAETCSDNIPVSTRMLKIAYMLFHIVGLDNVDLQKISSKSDEYYRLSKLIDRLTPYIKLAIKKIIDISKHYEKKTCGKVSTTTHVLERMYTDTFVKSKEVSINFNALDVIPKFLIKDTNIEEFVRSILLMIVAICGVYVLLMFLKGNSNNSCPNN